MLEPLTALSLASSVVQFVDFGQEIFALSRKIYKAGTGSVDEVERLERSIQNFRVLAEKLQILSGTKNGFEKWSNKVGQLLPFAGSASGWTDQAAAQALAGDCAAFADRSALILQDLHVKGKTGKWQSMKLAVMLKVKQSDMEKHEDELEKLRVEVMSLIVA